MWEHVILFSAAHTNRKDLTVLVGRKMTQSSQVWPQNNDPSVPSKAVLLQETFFQWCNDATHFCDTCAGQVIVWIYLCFFTLPAPLVDWMPVIHVLGLASRQKPNKVAVKIGTDRHGWETQVSLIGSHRCAHGCGASRLVEERHHRSGRKPLMPGMFVGMGWLRWKWGEGEEARWRTDHLDHRPQRPAWQSQSEQQWTEDSQSADFPSFAFSLAAFQKTQAVQQDFQKELQPGFFHQVKGDFFSFAYWKEEVDSNTKKHQEGNILVLKLMYVQLLVH